MALAEAPQNGDYSGLLIGTRGTVFVTMDAGASWSRAGSIGLRASEEIVPHPRSAFSADARHGVVVGSNALAFVTKDGGRTWKSTKRFIDRYDLSTVANLAHQDGDGETIYTTVALDSAGGLYNLEPHPELSGWRDMARATVLERMLLSPVFRESAIYRDMEYYVAGSSDAAGSRDSGSGEDEDEVLTPWEVLRDPNLALRVITIIFLFFLVAMFVRLYQYNLRLAAFWESRSDALILVTETSTKDSASFGELAAALSPDAHDFRPGPRTIPERMGMSAGMRRGRDSARPNEK